MKFIQNQNIGKITAELLQKEIVELQKTQPIVTIAFCGGRSTQAICSQLLLEDINWKKIHIFMVDERLVHSEDPDLNYTIIKESLIKPLGKKIPTQNIHPFILDTSRSDFGLNAYSEELLNQKGYFDVIILSAGEDGHVAGLFPNHETILDESLHFVKTFNSPKLPKDRMSASRKLILHSKVSFIVFSGQSKKSALDIFFDDSKKIIECPAKLVKYIPESYLITDLELPKTKRV